MPVPLAVAAIAAGTGYSVYSGIKQQKATKKASSDLAAQNAKAIAQAKAASTTAQDQAEKTMARRRSALTQTVYTSPLGLSGTANIARKTLLGE